MADDEIPIAIPLFFLSAYLTPTNWEGLEAWLGENGVTGVPSARTNLENVFEFEHISYWCSIATQQGDLLISMIYKNSIYD